LLHTHVTKNNISVTVISFKPTLIWLDQLAAVITLQAIKKHCHKSTTCCTQKHITEPSSRLSRPDWQAGTCSRLSISPFVPVA